MLLQEDKYSDSYISTIGVDFVRKHTDEHSTHPRSMLMSLHCACGSGRFCVAPFPIILCSCVQRWTQENNIIGHPA
eukprot:SAG31_NODE_20067_length_584_cov_1.556701_1_plen_75_part_10